jgi:hypothetical protein
VAHLHLHPRDHRQVFAFHVLFTTCSPLSFYNKFELLKIKHADCILIAQNVSLAQSSLAVATSPS